MIQWNLDEEHEIYGKVVMVRSIEGESYRWFINNLQVVSMIPLTLLLAEDKEKKFIGEA